MISQDYFTKVKKHFNGDDQKAWEWFKSQHANFGMLTPLNMIKLGRESRVKDYIDRFMK